MTSTQPQAARITACKKTGELIFLPLHHLPEPSGYKLVTKKRVLLGKEESLPKALKFLRQGASCLQLAAVPVLALRWSVEKVANIGGLVEQGILRPTNRLFCPTGYHYPAGAGFVIDANHEDCQVQEECLVIGQRRIKGVVKTFEVQLFVEEEYNKVTTMFTPEGGRLKRAQETGERFFHAEVFQRQVYLPMEHGEQLKLNTVFLRSMEENLGIARRFQI